MEIMKVKPWGRDQGDHVLLNVSDFDPARHEPYDEVEAAKVRMPARLPAPSRHELDLALEGLPGGHTDPDYVVNAMRAHWREVFTADDEARVRDLVRPGPKKPSDGLTVPEIKAALAAKGVAIPDGVTLKADLAALLDAAELPYKQAPQEG